MTAFLLLLERLKPTERAALLLHDILCYPFDDVPGVVEKTPVPCRQRIRAERLRFAASPTERDQFVEHFLTACRMGDVDRLRAQQADDATPYSDGG